jgi:hypothetical protein
VINAQSIGHVKTACLSEIADRIFRGIPTLTNRTQTEDQTVPFINIKDIVGGRVCPGEIETVSISPSERGRHQVRAGDVLLSCRGTVLKSAVVPIELDGAVPSSNLTIIRLKQGFHPQLLAAFFQSQMGQTRLLSRVQSSTQQKALTIAEIESIIIPLPSLEHQKILVGLLDAADQYYSAAIKAANMRREIAFAIAYQDIIEKSSMKLEDINE